MLPNLSNNPAKVTRLIIIVLALVAAVVIYLGFNQSTKGTLRLVVAPSDSNMVTSAGAKLKYGTNTLARGTYTITISKPHFVNQTFTVQVKAGQTITSRYALEASDAAGAQYYADHPDQAQLAEGISGQTSDIIAQQISKKQPLVNVLPVLGLNWRIDAGKSKKYPTDPSKVAIYVTAPDATNRTDALLWITGHGYKLSDYEIVYQDLATYNQQVNPGTAPPSSSSSSSSTPATFTPTTGQDYN